MAVRLDFTVLAALARARSMPSGRFCGDMKPECNDKDQAQSPGPGYAHADGLHIVTYANSPGIGPSAPGTRASWSVTSRLLVRNDAICQRLSVTMYPSQGSCDMAWLR